ncbi:MAG: histidine kinase, partial [Syntrophomonas sp.]|nr:histidine kinase [Syntrophomonas sp.]
MKLTKIFDRQRLNTQIIIIITFIVTILVGVFVAWSSYSQYKSALQGLHNSTSLLAQELMATRSFLTEKQGVINLDRDGTINFKHLNPSVAVRGISEIFNGTSGYTFKQTKLQ